MRRFSIYDATPDQCDAANMAPALALMNEFKPWIQCASKFNEP